MTINSAGNVFGALPQSGIHGSGSIFQLTKKPGSNKWTFRTIYNFCALLACKDGEGPGSGLVVDSAGNLYGATELGGSRNGGVFFELSPDRSEKNWHLTILHNFCSRNSACTDGGEPSGPLAYQGQTQGLPYDGASPLYGTAERFGAHGHGAVFSLQPKIGHEKWRETTLYSFCPQRFGPDCADGEEPYGITLDSTGNLIGVAGGGVPVGQFQHGGVLFKLSPVVGEKRWSESVIYSFCSQENCADGYDPSASPLLNQDGSLTGFTASGGANTAPECDGCGTIYRMTSGGTFTVLYNFCSKNQCNDGVVPLGTPAVDDAGNIFGAAEAGGPGKNDFNHVGGGTVFELSGSTLETLHAFCTKANCPDGEYPFPGIVMDGLGYLYGTTEDGGPNQTGEVFELQSSGAAEKFGGSSKANPKPLTRGAPKSVQRRGALPRPF